MNLAAIRRTHKHCFASDDLHPIFVRCYNLLDTIEKKDFLTTSGPPNPMTKMAPPAFVYRISTADEWAELERTGGTLGGDLDRSTGCIHLSDLSQVRTTLKNFFRGKDDLYLLQIDTAKIADGLIYEAADGCNHFPHFYGPDRSFAALPLSAVITADKIEISNNDFTCSLLDGPAL